MDDASAYTIGEAAKELGMPASTIRYYERRGLLPNLGRTEGGVRSFTDADLDWLRMIEHLKMSGMTIAEMRRFVELYAQGDASIGQRRDLVHHRRMEILKQIDELKATLDFITYKCWYYDVALEAGTCAVLHAMSEDEMPPEMAAIKRRCKIGSH